MNKRAVRTIQEGCVKWLCGIMACASLLFLTGIMLVLFKEGMPLFRAMPFFDVVLGKSWYPTYEPPEFGFLPLMLASWWVTLGAAVVCVPLGVGSALYIHEIAGPKQKALLKPIIELLASIPSIVFGLFGMVVVAPFIQDLFRIPTGLCALTGSIILGIMAVPTVCSLAEDALSAVPRSFREASLALGANRWRTLTSVVMPAAGSGISTAIILGMSRAIGETMTVLMVTGGAAAIPKTFLSPVRPMTATIAAEMGEVSIGSVHYQSLFAIGLVLFLITLCFNVIAEIISRRYRLQLGLGR